MLDPLGGQHAEPARRTAISRDGRELDPSTKPGQGQGCDSARKEMERGTAGADRWLEYNLKTLIRGRELVALLESDEVEDGALIKLEDAAEHSHLGRALDQQLPTPRKSALCEKLQGLLREYPGG